MNEPKIVGKPNAKQRAHLREALKRWPDRLSYEGNAGGGSRSPCAAEFLEKVAGDGKADLGGNFGRWYGLIGIITVNELDRRETQTARAARMKALLTEFAKEPGKIMPERTA